MMDGTAGDCREGNENPHRVFHKALGFTETERVVFFRRPLR
jgi:hypothetical protein